MWLAVVGDHRKEGLFEILGSNLADILQHVVMVKLVRGSLRQELSSTSLFIVGTFTLSGICMGLINILVKIQVAKNSMHV